MTMQGFELISPQDSKIKVFRTNRHGGQSLPPFDSFNLATHVGDSLELVAQNRMRLANLLNLPRSQTIYMNQVHGSEVGIVKKPLESPLTCDAMVTNQSKLALIVLVADCVPIVFVDDVNNAIGVAHAGWRGTADQVAMKTVQAMAAEFGTKAENLTAYIGPCIGACCYKVGAEVAKKVEQSISLVSSCSQPIGDGFFLDLREANRQQMLLLGIAREKVRNIYECTSCNSENTYSHRAESGQTGRFAMGAFIET